MIAANVLSKEEFPDFDEETGILPKVDDEEGMSWIIICLTQYFYHANKYNPASHHKKIFCWNTSSCLSSHLKFCLLWFVCQMRTWRLSWWRRNLHS